MRTGQHLKIKSMGQTVLGVKLEGNPKKPEPIHFRVVLPFGDVDIVRTTVNDYWVHIRVNHEETSFFVPGESIEGQFIDGRIDLTSKHSTDCDKGNFGHPDMNHMAVRIARK